MRHDPPITPSVVRTRTRQALQPVLDWTPFHKSVSVSDLLDLLVLMAASGASLFATVRRFFSFSHQTGSLAVKANLPSRENIDRLTRGLVDGLYDVLAFSSRDRRRPWMVAIDSHFVPYYGTPTSDVVGGQKKQGTRWFFGYATAVLLHKRRRYTIALTPLRQKAKPHEIVRLLLDQIAGKGLKIRGVALDSGFDSGETLLLLQDRQLAYSVPLRRKGKAATQRLFRRDAQPDSLDGMDHEGHPSARSDPHAALEERPQDDGVRLSGLERRSRSERSPTSAIPSPTVPASLRHRDELPPEEPGEGRDDEPRSGLPAVAGGLGLLVPPSLDPTGGRARSSFADVADRLDQRTAHAANARLARSRTQRPSSRNPRNQ